MIRIKFRKKSRFNQIWKKFFSAGLKELRTIGFLGNNLIRKVECHHLHHQVLLCWQSKATRFYFVQQSVSSGNWSRLAPVSPTNEANPPNSIFCTKGIHCLPELIMETSSQWLLVIKCSSVFSCWMETVERIPRPADVKQI